MYETVAAGLHQKTISLHRSGVAVRATANFRNLLAPEKRGCTGTSYSENAWLATRDAAIVGATRQWFARLWASGRFR